ncbi:serine/threonine-protein kinase [Gordonibacter sp. An230]|uniref:serine/threonine-protein kinase n=1 Tax=Gordonibacter sp. An230 TaxID=1965592 RepID=UPI00111F0CF3|nr:serine/threonine-protein kinase [Gordonibacter sp. An230]
MARNQQLILDRYRPIAEAGTGGFGTVQVAWDTRIQRKVAIKCIGLDEVDTMRVASGGPSGQNHPVGSGGATDVLGGSGPTWEAESADLDAPAFSDDEETALFDMMGRSVSMLDNDYPARVLARTPGLDEARTAALLSDANIVTVYDFEVQGSTAYLIMEYVDGITLSELLERFGDRISLNAVAAVFAAVSHALEVAHDNQVLHLDIKPDNVLVNRQGQVKVTDFGLAVLADASGFGVAGGGTVGYMPLEQMRQESLDARCDEWALASVTYEMLAGENPFLAEDLPRAEAAIEDAELVLPSLCWDELDPAIDDVIFRALDPDREERYDNVTEFADELEPFLGDPKRGTRELAAIVGYADEEEVDDEPVPASRAPRAPLRERITPGHRRAAARALGALGSALVAFVALGSIPEASGLGNPLFWGLLAMVAFAGALKPHLGALLSYGTLSVALVVQGAPAVGCALMAATGAWWYFVGREGDAEANVALAAPLVGALGGGQLAPLAAGFCLSPARAFVTAAFSLSTAAVLAALGSGSLLGWDAPAHIASAFDGSSVQALLGSMLMSPAFWCVAASWLVAAFTLAFVRQRPTRVFAVLGTVCAASVLVAGICAAAWAASGGLTWMPSVRNLAGTVVAVVAMLLACSLVPDPAFCEADPEEGAAA